MVISMAILFWEYRQYSPLRDPSIGVLMASLAFHYNISSGVKPGCKTVVSWPSYYGQIFLIYYYKNTICTGSHICADVLTLLLLLACTYMRPFL